MKITQTFGAFDNSRVFESFAIEAFENGTAVLQDGSIINHSIRNGKNYLTLLFDGRRLAEAEVTLMGIVPKWQVWASTQVSMEGAWAAQPVETFNTFSEAVEAAERIKSEKKFIKFYTDGTWSKWDCDFSHIQKSWTNE